MFKQSNSVDGPVSSSSTSCHCPLDLKEVCGSDNVTYKNECEFKCEQKKNYKLKLMANVSCEKQSKKNAVSIFCIQFENRMYQVSK